LKRTVGRVRIGHGGILDRPAEGVLPVGLGNATRLFEYFKDLPKTYESRILLGMASDTDDMSGEVISRTDATKIDDDVIKAALLRFTGAFTQTPPMYSAVKVGGRRMHEYAREKEAVTPKTRLVEVFSLAVNGIERVTDPKHELAGCAIVATTIVCSGGTYVRSIARDLGEVFGVGGLLLKLTRSRVGPFAVEDSLTTDQVAQMWEAERDKVIIPMAFVAQRGARARLNRGEIAKLAHGQPVFLRRDRLEDAEGGNLNYIYVISTSGELCGIGNAQPQGNLVLVKPRKIFS
jgi:tRNA pseudouridine55 synthase